MANQVYANGMEIACKAAAGKSLAAFPDTCLTPPPPPAGPVPVPYPNTAYASDTTKGTTTVMISGQEVMMKDQSTFKKSTGDEAATRAQGMGVITHTIQGEASFSAWSMDVKFEGANVDRHLDLMLHNEQCQPAQCGIVYLDAQASASTPGCGKARNQQRKATSLLSDSAKQRAYVTAGGSFNPSQGTGISSLGSSAVSATKVMRGGKYKVFSRGIKKRGASNVTCNGKRHQYATGTGRPKQGHAEAKMIEDIFRKAGGNPAGTLYLKISEPPCDDCQQLMECASEKIQIVICK